MKLRDLGVVEVPPFFVVKALDVGEVVAAVGTARMHKDGEELIHVFTLLEVLLDTIISLLLRRFLGAIFYLLLKLLAFLHLLYLLQSFFKAIVVVEGSAHGIDRAIDLIQGNLLELTIPRGRRPFDRLFVMFRRRLLVIYGWRRHIVWILGILSLLFAMIVYLI